MTAKIKQAVILAGGRGQRLMPLTASCPKPMVLVNQVPFLQYLLDQLVDAGFERIVLLTGYLSHVVSDYFGNSYRGLSITYSVQSASYDTAQRVYAARHLFDEQFLLMYSDNYINFSIKNHIADFSSKDALRLVVSNKQNGNIVLSEDRAVHYDNSRTNSNACFVELGFMCVNKAMLMMHLHEQSINFNEVIISAISHQQVSVTRTIHPYHSISDPQRLKLTEAYLRPRKVLLLDRDGTINQKAPRGEYIVKWDDFTFIPGVLDALRELAEQGFEFVIISNQAGIGRGLYSVEDVNELHQKMTEALAEFGIKLLDIFICPHHWEDQCDCRKPRPGMFIDCEKKHLLDISKLIYVGDDPRDMQASHAAGCESIYVGEQSEISMADEHPSLECVNSLGDAQPIIVKHYKHCE